MTPSLDKTFCASQNCTNECGRNMSLKDKESLKELAFRGIKVSTLISYAYFCGEPEPCEHVWDGVLLNRPYAGNLGLCKLCGAEFYIALKNASNLESKSV